MLKSLALVQVVYKLLILVDLWVIWAVHLVVVAVVGVTVLFVGEGLVVELVEGLEGLLAAHVGG